MSWLFSQALVEEFSAGTCSDGEPSAQLNVMPTRLKFWHNDKTIDCSDLSRFGLTCRVLTADRGSALLMSYLAASPARTFPKPGAELESRARVQAYGDRWPGSLAKYDPATSTWKTALDLLPEDLNAYLGTWPRWGLMLDGEFWALTTPALHTSENESGFWPTPTAIKRNGGAALCKWGGARAREKLRTMVSQRELNGPLGTEFPSWLMGWPIGWSSLEPLETARFQEWQQQHGACSSDRNPLEETHD